MLLKKTTQQVLLIAVLVFINLTIQGQKSKLNKYKLNAAVQTVLDLDYSIPGIAFDIGISSPIYKKFNIKLWYHHANTHQFVAPKYKMYGYTANPGNPQSGIIHDIYANHFIGQSASIFFNGKAESFNKNTFLLNLAFNKEFGKRRYRFIPEFGASIGGNHQFKMFLKAIGHINGIIETATSQASFVRTFVRGVNLSLNQEYKISKKSYIELNIREYLTTGFDKHYYSIIGGSYEAINIGFTYKIKL